MSADVVYAPGAVSIDRLLPVPDHLSYSQVTKLAPGYLYGCPRAWAYQYRLGLPYEAGPAMHCGTALDAGINAFYFRRMKGATVAEAAELAEHEIVLVLAAAFADDGVAAELYQITVLHGFAAWVLEHRDVIPAVVQMRHEFSVRAYDGNVIRVVGYSDAIHTDGVIVDHKWSGKPRWNADGEWYDDWVAARRDQIVFYWLARMAEAGQVVKPLGRLTVVYMHPRLKQAQCRSLDMHFTPVDVARVLERIRIAYALMGSGRYPARPGLPCQFCSYVERCRHDEEMRTPAFAVLTGIAE